MNRHLVGKYIGIKMLDGQMTSVKVKAVRGDFLIVVSDTFGRMVVDERTRDVISTHETFEEARQAAMQAALAVRSAKNV